MTLRPIGRIKTLGVRECGCVLADVLTDTRVLIPIIVPCKRHQETSLPERAA